MWFKVEFSTVKFISVPKKNVEIKLLDFIPIRNIHHIFESVYVELK